jgi:hypothetical protein
VNVDSLTELGEELATRYFRRAAEVAPTFLSVNHEANPFRVIDLHQKTGVFRESFRVPYWVRKGYVEEVFRR